MTAATDGMTAVGAYAAATNPITAAAQTEVLEEIDKFLALFPDPTAETPRPGHPDLNHLHPISVGRIRVEIAALKTAIDATPVA